MRLLWQASLIGNWTEQPSQLCWGPTGRSWEPLFRRQKNKQRRRKKDELDAALQEATTSVAETAGSELHQVQQVIKATGAAQFHALKVAVGPLVDEAKQEMEEYDGCF